MPLPDIGTVLAVRVRGVRRGSWQRGVFGHPGGTPQSSLFEIGHPLKQRAPFVVPLLSAPLLCLPTY